MDGVSTMSGDAATEPVADRLHVEIWSDLVCPWCYVGRARFGLALGQFAQRDSVDVTYRSFELDPDAPAGSTTTVAEMLASKYGGRTEAIRVGEQRLVEMAAELGLGYRVDRLHGNTLDAHRLVQLGIDRGLGDVLVDRLFRANFAEGRSIFDAEALAEIGTGGWPRSSGIGRGRRGHDLHRPGPGGRAAGRRDRDQRRPVLRPRSCLWRQWRPGHRDLCSRARPGLAGAPCGTERRTGCPGRGQRLIRSPRA